jgi:hypothetical protein
VYLGYAHPALSYFVESVCATILVNMDVADLMELAGHLNARVQPERSYAAANAFALMDPVFARYPRVTAQVFAPYPRVIAQVFAPYLRLTAQAFAPYPRVIAQVFARYPRETVQVFAIRHRAAARDSELLLCITCPKGNPKDYKVSNEEKGVI